MHSKTNGQRTSRTIRGGVVALLLLLAAGPASAGALPEPEAAPAEAWTQPGAFDLEAPRPEDSRPHAAFRIGAEASAGIVTSMGLGLGGAFAGGLAGALFCGGARGGFMSVSSDCALVGAVVIGSAAAGIGLPLGVSWGGKMTGGNGRFLGAFGGLGAALVCAGSAHLLGQKNLGAALLVASPVFSVVGYELTDSEPGSEPASGVAPSVVLGQGGASFGLQGRF